MNLIVVEVRLEVYSMYSITMYSFALCSLEHGVTQCVHTALSWSWAILALATLFGVNKC